MYAAQGDLSFQEVKNKYFRPNVALPGAFVVGTLTFGLKTSFDNFSLTADVSGSLQLLRAIASTGVSWSHPSRAAVFMCCHDP